MARRKSSALKSSGTRRLRATSGRSSRHLFENWERVTRRLRAARQIALLLDFDGTLAPICSRPEQVLLPTMTRRVLKRLSRRRNVRVAIISGRRAAEVRSRVRIPGVTYIGLHGWERIGKSQNSEAHRFVDRLRREVEARLRGLGEIWVEDKFISFVVHYRRASPAAVGRARESLREVIAPHRQKLRVMNGKKVWEVLPLEVKGKGEAVLEVLKEIKQPALAVYAGDDTTDEEAFRVLPNGLTVRVGTPRRTHAQYVLRNVDEVCQFLEKLEAEIA
jgi:trehalose-phosphatase